MDKTLLLEQCERVMHANWTESGYTAPNKERYPWQWLWDSCFHAIIWAELGYEDRAVTELETLLSTIEPSGFVPHMNYVADPSKSLSLWGRKATSTITQPPMFGHAVAELVRRGLDVPEALVDRAAEGLLFFLRFRRHKLSGLIRLCHPWESGADNNPRWDGYYSLEYGDEKWQDEKIGFLKTIQRDSEGTPLSNPAFDAASVGFTALVAFNIFELSSITGSIDTNGAHELAEAVGARWLDGSHTWDDVGIDETDTDAPVSDALLCLLVDEEEGRAKKVSAQLFDDRKFGGQYGPAGVSKEYEVYNGDGYWRGAAWPQLSYLLWLALRARGRTVESSLVAKQLCEGAMVSGFAEHWNPDTGTPGGAVPQSWAALCAVVQ